jgi:hypothetical protein
MPDVTGSIRGARWQSLFFTVYFYFS